jgi:hypothetical protein
MKKDTIYRQVAIDGISGFMTMPVKLKRGASTSEQAADQIINSIWDTAISCVESYLWNMPSAESKDCEGCKHLGLWENEVEYGYSSPCTFCKRRIKDNYER